jgi:hypothetical protein
VVCDLGKPLVMGRVLSAWLCGCARLGVAVCGWLRQIRGQALRPRPRAGPGVTDDQRWALPARRLRSDALEPTDRVAGCLFHHPHQLQYRRSPLQLDGMWLLRPRAYRSNGQPASAAARPGWQRRGERKLPATRGHQLGPSAHHRPNLSRIPPADHIYRPRAVVGHAPSKHIHWGRSECVEPSWPF